MRALIGHDDSMVIGRMSAGTLRLRSDEKGLGVEIDLPDTSYARDLRELLKRGDISQMSFAFSVPDGGDSWGPGSDGAKRLRTLNDVNLHEVSVVAVPAYPDTTAALRSMRTGMMSFRDRQLWLARYRRSSR